MATVTAPIDIPTQPDISTGVPAKSAGVPGVRSGLALLDWARGELAARGDQAGR